MVSLRTLVTNRAVTQQQPRNLSSAMKSRFWKPPTVYELPMMLVPFARLVVLVALTLTGSNCFGQVSCNAVTSNQNKTCSDRLVDISIEL